MATAKTKTKATPKPKAQSEPARPKKLLHFHDYDDQEARDLAYGAQKALCQKYEQREVGFVDASIEGNWTPDHD